LVILIDDETRYFVFISEENKNLLLIGALTRNFLIDFSGLRIEDFEKPN